MKPETIRRVDGLLGPPVCWVLTLVRRLTEFWRRRDDSPPKRILFLKLVELGANVQAYAAFSRAIERVGRENVFFWVFDENRTILEFLNLVPPENLLIIRSKGLVPFAIDVLRTLRKIRRLKIDAVVDMEFFARASAILTFLTGSRRRVGLHRYTSIGPYRGDLLTHRVQHNPYLHVSRYFLQLVESLDYSGDECPLPKQPQWTEELGTFRFQPSDAERRALQERIVRVAGCPVDRPIVLLNPNASDIVPLRKWPLDRFREVGRRLLAAHPDLSVIITGSPAEQASAEEFAKSLGSSRAISMAGKTSLRELLVLYTLSDILVTNDSGPGQFASMTDIDAVVLFGPETPLLWGPLGPRSHVLWANLACSPCINPFNFRFSPCTDPVCMTALTVEQVVTRVETILLARTAARL